MQATMIKVTKQPKRHTVGRRETFREGRVHQEGEGTGGVQRVVEMTRVYRIVWTWTELPKNFRIIKNKTHSLIAWL